MYFLHLQGTNRLSIEKYFLQIKYVYNVSQGSDVLYIFVERLSIC